MSWTRFLLNDFFTARELNQAEEERRAMRRSLQRRNRTLQARVETLEDDIGRVALIARTLVEVVLQKNVLTRDELDALIEHVDGFDGKIDGRLSPSDTRPPPDAPSGEE